MKTTPEVRTPPNTRHMRIGVTGASGFIGSALCRTLADNGITVLRLVRHESPVGCEVTWNPSESFEPDSRLERLDAIVHLASSSKRCNAFITRQLRSSKHLASGYMAIGATKYSLKIRPEARASYRALYRHGRKPASPLNAVILGECAFALGSCFPNQAAYWHA